MAARSCSVSGLFCAIAIGLAGCASAPARPDGRSTPLEALDHATFRWVSAQCVDGVLDLARQGFERTLSTELIGSRLRFTYETRLAQPQCVSTQVWSLSPEDAGQWRFSADADVRLPADAPCGAALPQADEHGVVNLNGDVLEELRFGSAWCRGFDARFVYRRIPERPLAQAELIRRYVAHWNRRDPSAIAALFSQNGSLSEPFSRSPDGLPVRHEGRPQIEAWLQSAFESVPWLALQLNEIETLDEQGQSLARWRYFDPKLSEPLQGRNLFVLAGGEIFATELQLVSEPVPAPAAP
ncbi:MAG: nuclear transport factor 2 family protein [Polyangiales bacterium]